MAARLVGERRGAPRKEVHLSVLCRSGIRQGSARLVDISLTGAQLEMTTIRPAEGMLVKVRLDSPSIELKGKVVRHTAHGFAIQFLSVLTKEVADLMAGLP